MLWYRGNTHTHTTNSDGDAPLDVVVDWYRRHGYQFLVITDHNKCTDVSAYAGAPDFLVLPGNELSLVSEGKPVHLCGLNYRHDGKPEAATTIVETLQRAVDTIRRGDGLAVVNHPNFRWAFDDEAMAQVRAPWILEVINTSTDCNNWGGGGTPSVETMWDRLLSRGLHVFGLASDDTHNYHERYGHVSPPGLAWICVQAEELSPAAVMGAIARGCFYLSTEVELATYAAGRAEISLSIVQQHQYRYTTQFIGQDGKLLAEVDGCEAIYCPRGDESYVRARVRSSNGGFAWTQPIFLAD